ncbi:MAG: hypothetical protein HY689_11775 [Chloroflexi bacterium]|nr:hypothetical protein [Chloroflexota bacterium]
MPDTSSAPTLEAFLFCDTVLRDQHGLDTLIRVFTDLHLPGPGETDFSVYLRFAGGSGPHQIWLEFESPSYEHLALGEELVTVPGAVATPVHMVIREPGRYTVQVYLDGYPLAEKALQVTFASARSPAAPGQS